MKQAILLLGTVLLSQLGLAQISSSELPCSYSGELLRDKAGKTVRFTSDEMNARATRKIDINSGFMGYLDFRAIFLLEVLVGPTGKVVCTKSLHGFPPADAKVGKALQQWEFKPANQGGKPVASLGLLEFYLCNINCGEQGMSMSLLH